MATAEENQKHVSNCIINKDPVELTQILSFNPKLANWQDDDGRTPLMKAISETNDLEFVSALIPTLLRIDTDIELQDNAGFAALHIAASLGAEFVKLILEFKPDLESRTNNRQTPLLLAVSKNKIDAVKLLLDSGASPRPKDRRQVTALQRAAAIGSVPLVELLLKAGAPINATDMNGWTALHFAYAEDHSEVTELLEKHGASEQENSDGEKPKDLAPKRY